MLPTFFQYQLDLHSLLILFPISSFLQSLIIACLRHLASTDELDFRKTVVIPPRIDSSKTAIGTLMKNTFVFRHQWVLEWNYRYSTSYDDCLTVENIQTSLDFNDKVVPEQTADGPSWSSF